MVFGVMACSLNLIDTMPNDEIDSDAQRRKWLKQIADLVDLTGQRRHYCHLFWVLQMDFSTAP